jgi:hypothetical protein
MPQGPPNGIIGNGNGVGRGSRGNHGSRHLFSLYLEFRYVTVNWPNGGGGHFRHHVLKLGPVLIAI